MSERRTERVYLPNPPRAPLAAVGRRIGAALGLVVFVALVVRLGRGGYVDATGDAISFLDALYYASVTVTTTGYGDITAVSSGARLATILLITPARILFLILVVGTTVEVLTEQSRTHLLTRRWRRRVNDHYVICGFGATGQAAVQELLARGVRPESIVVVDLGLDAVRAATELGMVAIRGDATQNEVLREAAIDRAQAVVVAPSRDDTAVLMTLTARELNADIHIVAAGRDKENLHLLRQSGASEVIDVVAAVGRMLGLATDAPEAVHVLNDVLDAGEGLELATISPIEINDTYVVPSGVTLVAATRNGHRMTADELEARDFRANDRLIVLRPCAD